MTAEMRKPLARLLYAMKLGAYCTLEIPSA